MKGIVDLRVKWGFLKYKERQCSPGITQSKKLQDVGTERSNSMNNNKSPGNDGFTEEFFICFLVDLDSVLVFNFKLLSR